MRLEWLDDLLAVIDTGSLTEAARQRHLTQPAFSRRIRAIEQAIGAELFDRTRKPLQLKQVVLEQDQNMRNLAQALRQMRRELAQDNARHRSLIMVSQHAISTAIAPYLIKTITAGTDNRIRLRSANRDECYSLLLTGKADIGLLYQLEDEQPAQQEQFADVYRFAQEPLIPVIARSQHALFQRERANGCIRVVAYPQDVFLGAVMQRVLLPELEEFSQIQWVAETALTTAALQFALAGVGLAWVPLSLASKAIDQRELIRLDPNFPNVSMYVTALKLTSNVSPFVDAAWRRILEMQYASY